MRYWTSPGGHAFRVEWQAPEGLATSIVEVKRNLRGYIVDLDFDKADEVPEEIQQDLFDTVVYEKGYAEDGDERLFEMLEAAERPEYQAWQNALNTRSDK